MRPSNANNFEGSEDVNNLQDDQNYSDDHNPLNGRPPANRMNTQTGFQMPLATKITVSAGRRNQARSCGCFGGYFTLDSFEVRRLVTLTTGAGNRFITSFMRRSGKH